jgi:arginase family enzyme
LAFYFFAKQFEATKQKLDLVHIDQHSDMREPKHIPQNLENIEKYTFE